MADEPDTLVLKLLREIRAQIALPKDGQSELKAVQAEVIRETADLRAANARAIGYAHQVAVKQTRIDRKFVALHNRVPALEAHTGLVRDL